MICSSENLLLVAEVDEIEHAAPSGQHLAWLCDAVLHPARAR